MVVVGWRGWGRSHGLLGDQTSKPYCPLGIIALTLTKCIKLSIFLAVRQNPRRDSG